MGQENLAGIGLRLTQIATLTSTPGNSLASFDGTEYPDGALVFVNENGTLYALDKDSTIDPAGSAVVAAIGGGNWIALVGSGTASFYSVMVELNQGSYAVSPLVQNEWTALPTGANRFVKSGSGLFTMDTSSGILTYNGPDRSFWVQGSLTFTASAGTTSNYGFSFSPSDAAILGTTNSSNYEAIAEAASTTDFVNVSFIGRIATLSDGETVQGVIRNLSGTDGMSVSRYQLLLTPTS